ncbi:protein-disulfide reductase DsbD domain-containing protein [Thalassobellus suaedae]|uniref:Protein-disulfide reductase DsbD family protein n=1 Tax=Thalassobellus suaedae TaxID=3074124 RepID=A0ABY9Y0T8_9FLAO|nr:protein-disulfide reductase DsbD family protein [Flavobacteriaceae bacterium HL-DH10]
MKKLILLVALTIVFIGQAQVLEPVKWNASVNKISDSEYELVATATIDKGWHLYSQSVPKDGPISTGFTFVGNKNYLKKGNTSEEVGYIIDDPIFEMEIKYFEKMADFKQRIKLKGKVPFQVKGAVEFMVCNDRRCLSPTEVELIFNVK